MAMDLRDPNVWMSHLLEKLPEEKQASALKDDNPDWEYIDGEIVKLGSLAHSQLNIPELQQRGLLLLASESKDFRLLAHLLRTLQHAGDPLQALRLLTLYMEHYWTVAAPQNMAHKKRFASQVIKRFEAGITVFAKSAVTAQRDALLGELAKLAQCWQSHNVPELAQATDDLFALYQRAFNGTSPVPSSTPAIPGNTPQTTVMPESGMTQSGNPATLVTIDNHDDKAWRDTLLKVATILCERQPDSPQGYRLRRHALWQSITSLPQIAVNQILYHCFICLLLKLHDLLLCHISRTGFILAGQWWKHFIFIIYRRPGSPFAGCHVHQRESYQIAQRYRIGQFFTFVVGPHS